MAIAEIGRREHNQHVPREQSSNLALQFAQKRFRDFKAKCGFMVRSEGGRIS